MNQNTVYSDLDGTIYDFYGAINKIHGFDCGYRLSEHINFKFNMSVQTYIKLNFEKLIDNGLFDIGGILGDADKYLSLIKDKCKNRKYSLKVLGALPYNSKYSEQIQASKIGWLKRKGLIHLFDDLIFVNGSNDKILYCSQNTILIDDYHKTQSQFNKDKLPFILHRNWTDSYTEVSKFLSFN